MSSKTQKNQTADQSDVLFGTPLLLITESADEFAALREALRQEIKPKGIIEQIYLNDLASIVWEIQRLRRCKTGIINNAFRTALQKLLCQLLTDSNYLSRCAVEERADALARDWFSSQRGKKEVLEILHQFHLDESAIEAEAIRISSANLELLDRMLTSLRSRFDKALRCVAEYRHSFAKQLQQSSDRILERNDVLRLEHASDKRSAKA
jgi:hypothetical protein